MCIECWQTVGMIERTVILEDVKRGTPYTWGQVRQIHTIGEYDIIEYHPWIVEGCSIRSGSPNLTEREFAGYVNGQRTHQSLSTLDEAIAFVIAYKYEGVQPRAWEYFMKMLKNV